MADGRSLSLNLEFTDHEGALLKLRHSVLHAFAGQRSEAADASLTLSAEDLKLLLCGVTPLDVLEDEGRISVTGDAEALRNLLGMLDAFPRWFPIVTPRSEPS